MKKMLVTFIILILTIFLFSCNDDPVSSYPKASFEVEGAMISNSSIKFINTSEDAEFYEWNFGDETRSKEKNPQTKSYPKPGLYPVTLTIYNSSDPSKKRIATKVLDLKPTRVDITKIVALTFSNEGTGENYPDPYVKIFSGGILKHETSWRDDVIPPVTWDLSGVSALKNLPMNNDIVFEVWDYDPASANDYIGKTEAFRLVDLKYYYPREHLVKGNNIISLQVHLNWY